MKKVVLLLSLVALISGCSKSYEAPCTKQVSADIISALDQTQLQKDIVAIDDYLLSKAIIAIKDPSGLRYVITVAGDDTRPCLENSVIVKYAGRFFNGKGFDAAVNPVQFSLGKLILGWQIGFTNFGKGTKATLYIPSGFGYGINETKNAEGVTTIPANANLIFDIQLINF